MPTERIRVLIVEDSHVLRHFLEKLFDYLAPDIEVIASAANGTQGIDLSREHKPDIVLMDINLPDLDGLSATETILQEAPLSQVILMSGHEQPEYQQRSAQVGACHLLVKPIDGDELVATIRRVHTLRAAAD